MIPAVNVDNTWWLSFFAMLPALNVDNTWWLSFIAMLPAVHVDNMWWISFLAMLPAVHVDNTWQLSLCRCPITKTTVHVYKMKIFSSDIHPEKIIMKRYAVSLFTWLIVQMK
jgi:hypothetical protein